MIISQLSPLDKERFNSTHTLLFKGQGNSILMQLSGIVTLDYRAHKSDSSSRGWAHEDLVLILALPQIDDKVEPFYVEQCSPLITLNGIGGVSTVGWTVNSVQAKCGVTCNGSYELGATLGVYNSGEVLHKVGYTITLSGHFTA